MIEAFLEKTLHGARGPFRLSVRLHIETDRLIALYGPSGSGKTPILRMIAGLETPENGFIRADGVPWFDSEKGVLIPAHKRKVGLVFQSYALFPNMTIAQNITYAMPRKDQAKLKELLQIAGVLDLKDRYPDTLSGGQKQRIALIRSIASEPRSLLLDEPLSALDARLRLELQEEVLRLHRRYTCTTLLVSHDKQEVFKMADWMLCLSEGRILSEGTPKGVFFKRHFSPKFAVTGRVLSIEKADILFRAYVATSTEVLQVVLGEQEAKRFKPGDEVLIASKAFNPLLLPINGPMESVAFTQEGPQGIGYMD
jgi:molybdate transport system ATP-binding protein